MPAAPAQIFAALGKPEWMPEAPSPVFSGDVEIPSRCHFRGSWHWLYAYFFENRGGADNDSAQLATAMYAAQREVSVAPARVFASIGKYQGGAGKTIVDGW